MRTGEGWVGVKIGGPESSSNWERIVVYAEPKSGKTRFVTSLPSRFGKIVYIAADPGSEALAPVLPQYKDRIYVVRYMPEPGKEWSPSVDAAAIANTNWVKSEATPGAQTLIWDTMTATALQILSHIADSNQFSSSHVSI